MLNHLDRLWREYPDLRLGQLMMNLAHTGPSLDLFHIEDEDLVKRMEDARREWMFLKENGDGESPALD